MIVIDLTLYQPFLIGYIQVVFSKGSGHVYILTFFRRKEIFIGFQYICVHII